MKTRSYQKELLDAEGIPKTELYRNLYELDRINALLGGHALTQSAFKTLVSRLSKKQLHVVELGSGGGDNLRVLSQLAKALDIEVHFTGVDLKADCIAYAKEYQGIEAIEWVQSDYREFKPSKPIDICFSSLFCHHLNDEQMVEYLEWNRCHSRYFFINDLHRHQLAKWSIGLLTRLFSKSNLVKHDAPLSVARGFHKHELESYLKEAQVFHYELNWKWAFRWLLLAKGDIA